MDKAGTGPSAFAELNYTPQAADGSTAVDINEQVEVSKQFWAYQVDKGYLPAPHAAINNVPHMSFVWGEENIVFLRKRYAALQQENLFKGMQFSEDAEQIRTWAPLVMNGRDNDQGAPAVRLQGATGHPGMGGEDEGNGSLVWPEAERRPGAGEARAPGQPQGARPGGRDAR